LTEKQDTKRGVDPSVGGREENAAKKRPAQGGKKRDYFKIPPKIAKPSKGNPLVWRT